MKKILSYLKYLTPVLISKHSYDFDSKDFITSLRLNTQSPFGGEKQILRDRRIGRRNNHNSLTLAEYDNLLFIRSHVSSRWNPFTLIWIKDKNKLSFFKICFPDFNASFITIGILALLIHSLFSTNSSIYYVIFSVVLFLLINIMLHDSYDEQNELIHKSLFYNRGFLDKDYNNSKD